MLQACMDESGQGDPDLFVLAGYVSTTERWAAFSDEWQKLLDHRDPEHFRALEYFKMSEMQSERDRERCRWFHNVIEEYALGAISYTISTKVLRHEVERMFTEPEWRHGLSNPWAFATSALLPVYARNRQAINLPEGPIDFVFDDRSDKKIIIENWDRFKSNNPDCANLMGATPIFRSDREYLPLQAADLFAWWVRHWQLDGIKGNEISQCEFPWPRTTPMPWSHVVSHREQIRDRLREIRAGLGNIHRFTFPPSSGPQIFSNLSVANMEVGKISLDDRSTSWPLGRVS
jgi:hypothetical protein